MSKTIKEQIEAKLHAARRNNDEATRNVIGMLKSKLLNELKSGSGAVESDALWLETIQSYAKQARKTIAEYEKVGERGASLLAEARHELEFCNQFLPKKLDEAATLALVEATMQTHNIRGPKLLGKLVGLVLKDHKDSVDGDLLRQVATRALAEP